MHGVEEIIRGAEALSPDDRLMVVEALLRTLRPIDPAIERLWIDEAKRRLDDLRSGRVQLISGAEMVRELRERFPAP